MKESQPRPDRKHVTLAEILFIGAALGVSPAFAEAGPSAPQAHERPASAIDGQDISQVLAILLNTPERRQLAAGLVESLRQGDLEKAENKLNAAIEGGTLAIMLVDRLHDPKLLPSLQALGIQENDAASSASAENRTCRADNGSNTSDLASLQEALDREQARGDAAAQDLATFLQDYHALLDHKDSTETSLNLQLSNLRNYLQQEKERGDMTADQLAKLQDAYRTLQERHAQDAAASSSKIADLETTLQREQERRDAIARQLTAAERHNRLEREARLRVLANNLDELRQRLVPLDSIAMPLLVQLEASGMPALSTAGRDEERMPPFALLPPPIPVPEQSGDAPEVVVVASAELDASETGSTASPAQAAVASPASVPSITSPVPATTDERLLARADELLRKGDVSSARLLLERAAGTGNPRALFQLAETYDPRVLSRLGVLGIRGDEAKARELYDKARSLGVTQASASVEILRK